MISVKSKNSKRLQFVGLLLAVGLIVSISLFQLVLNQKLQRLPLSVWLKPSFWPQVFKAIGFKPPILGEPAVLSDDIAVHCQQDCYFILEGNQQKPLPALVENRADGRLKELELKFYDAQAGLIGYQTVNQPYPVFYVVNREPTLLQSVQLNLNDKTFIEFVAYYPSPKKILFKAQRFNGGESWYYLYSADSPDLQLLKTRP
jgi:hypothetical protein